MTQEELDELVAGDIEEEVIVEESSDDIEMIQDGENYPPAPIEEHKVVNQLDDVTRDSEIKANEIFDKLDEINDHIEVVTDDIDTIQASIKDNIELFEKLTEKFPNMDSFTKALEKNKHALEKCESVKEQSENSSDDIMMIMDIMQYQDIHRQKIERVINVMRALSKYMNSLFESEKDDNVRVSSAAHIDGDNAEIVDEDEIEALLASFGKK